VRLPSGGFRVEALVLVPGASALASALLAPLFAAAASRAGLAPVCLGLAWAYGLASGVLSVWAVRASRARAPGLAAALSSLGGAWGFYLSLAGWAGICAAGAPEGGLREAFALAAQGALRLGRDPAGLARIALGGSCSPWIFMGIEIRGHAALAALALEWLAFTAGIWLPARRLASRPYSEGAGVWLSRARP
jgi:hypothetical protein